MCVSLVAAEVDGRVDGWAFVFLRSLCMCFASLASISSFLPSFLILLFGLIIQSRLSLLFLFLSFTLYFFFPGYLFVSSLLFFLDPGVRLLIYLLLSFGSFSLFSLPAALSFLFLFCLFICLFLFLHFIFPSSLCTRSSPLRLLNYISSCFPPFFLSSPLLSFSSLPLSLPPLTTGLQR